jgi:hypothetical protein
MVQVNFVIACANGHLGEFPWFEWVHRGAACQTQSAVLSLKSTGAAELKSQVVSCNCGKRRNLSGTQDFDVMRSMNGKNSLDSLCPGSRPWLHDVVDNCGQPFRMIQRNANNLYFPATESSILIPEEVGTVGEVVEVVASSPFLNTYFELLVDNDWDYGMAARLMRHGESVRYSAFTVDELSEALRIVEPQTETIQVVGEPAAFDRHPEFAALTQEREHPQLTVRKSTALGGVRPEIQQVFEVVKLNRTIALKGFSRLVPDAPTLGAGKALLRRNPFAENAKWLPAVRHAGEGMLFQFDISSLAPWESSDTVQSRVQFASAGNTRELAHGQALSARFMLLHTFSHAMMQQLVQYSGYTSASLAERVYATTDSAGVLLFTAAGDADGTMGGLSELARSNALGRLVERAIEAAEWCTSDPICSQFEHSDALHQVPNLAACHNCVFVPETACDYSNMGLDRALLTGGLGADTDELRFFKLRD